MFTKIQKWPHNIYDMQYLHETKVKVFLHVFCLSRINRYDIFKPRTNNILCFQLIIITYNVAINDFICGESRTQATINIRQMSLRHYVYTPSLRYMVCTLYMYCLGCRATWIFVYTKQVISSYKQYNQLFIVFRTE